MRVYSLFGHMLTMCVRFNDYRQEGESFSLVSVFHIVLPCSLLMTWFFRICGFILSCCNYIVVWSLGGKHCSLMLQGLRLVSVESSHPPLVLQLSSHSTKIKNYMNWPH